jgi:thiamine-monophosphate kinase
VTERAFIAHTLAPLATTAAARGLADDAAVWMPPLGRELVFTHDMLASGVHFLASDPPADVAWKAIAVNLSDLAAMAATPVGVLIGLGLGHDAAWRDGFAAGLATALAHFGVALWGGDTIAGLASPVVGVTAIGWVEPGRALGRSGARAGDALWVSGRIGAGGHGLAVARSGVVATDADRAGLRHYRRPSPRLALGRALGGQASAGMDVSDGLLIDAARLAAASGVACHIALDNVPWFCPGDAVDALLAQGTAGDDYELLFAAPPGLDVAALAGATPVACIGRVDEGTGLTLSHRGQPVPLPARLGWEYG